MAEFKINSALLDEIKKADQSAQNINDGYQAISDGDVKTLQTAVAFVDQHAELKSLLELYKSLVQRDLKDLQLMAEEAAAMDEKIANSTSF